MVMSVGVTKRKSKNIKERKKEKFSSSGIQTHTSLLLSWQVHYIVGMLVHGCLEDKVTNFSPLKVRVQICICWFLCASFILLCFSAETAVLNREKLAQLRTMFRDPTHQLAVACIFITGLPCVHALLV